MHREVRASRGCRGRLKAFYFFLLAACGSSADHSTSDIADVPHTAVEQQSIGNCFLYARASWVEALSLARTGTVFDISESYWSYWYWYEQITKDTIFIEIEPGGDWEISKRLIERRGLMAEQEFIAEDSSNAISVRQSDALACVNHELNEGQLASLAARANGETVRDVLDQCWRLEDNLRAVLDAAFGLDGKGSLPTVAQETEPPIHLASEYPVRYSRSTSVLASELVDTSLASALDEFAVVEYPESSSPTMTKVNRRRFLQRIQRALHDAQPVPISWAADLNALSFGGGAPIGAFTLGTLKKNGPGVQSGHAAVIEDYEASTSEFGTLSAGTVLDPGNPGDKAKLNAALSGAISFFRVKNSWGTEREDRAFVEGHPGYNDIYLDYLNGPIRWCEEVTDEKTDENCSNEIVPLHSVVLPPGY